MLAVEKVITAQADTSEKLVPGLTARSISTVNSFDKMKVHCTNKKHIYCLEYTVNDDSYNKL